MRLEEAGAFENYVDAHFFMRQVAGIALGRHRDSLAVYGDAASVGADIAGETPMRRIILEQQRVGPGIGQVIDRDQIEIMVVAFQHSARDEPADATETINSDFDSHRITP